MTKSKEKRSMHSVPKISSLAMLKVDASRTPTGMCVSVCGVIGMTELSDSKVILASHGGRVSITGNSMRANLFENNTVEICGRIEEMRFIYDKN